MVLTSTCSFGRMQQNNGVGGVRALGGYAVGYVLETHLGRGEFGELWIACVREEGPASRRFVVEFSDSGAGGDWLKPGACFLFVPQPHPKGPQFIGSVPLDGNVQALVGWQQVLCTCAYVLEHCIGHGGYGQVWRALKSDVGVHVAIKFLFFNSNFTDLRLVQNGESRQVKMLRREVQNHIKLGKHPHIIQLYDFIWIPGLVPALVMEYASGGTLSGLLSKRGSTLTHEEAAHYFRQLIAAVEHMHSLNVVNRDIKPCNCLLDQSHQVLKMCDFGMSKDTLDTSVKSHVGTIQCRAPEVMEAVTAYDGKLADIWCCGVLLYSILTGQYPFQRIEEENDPNLKQTVREMRAMMRIASDPPDIYRHPAINSSAWDLITRTLTRDPKDRLTLAEIRAHPFFMLGMDDGGAPARSDTMNSSASTNIVIPTQSGAVVDQVFRAARPDVPLTPSDSQLERDELDLSLDTAGIDMLSLSLDDNK